MSIRNDDASNLAWLERQKRVHEEWLADGVTPRKQGEGITQSGSFGPAAEMAAKAREEEKARNASAEKELLTLEEKRLLLRALRAHHRDSKPLCSMRELDYSLQLRVVSFLDSWGYSWDLAEDDVEAEIIKELREHILNTERELADKLDAALEHQRALTDAVNPGPTAPSTPVSPLPDDSKARKSIPLWEGVLAYFPAALIAAAKVSKLGNEKHNPGEELHHARGKSTDHTDCIARHLVDYQALKASINAAGDGSDVVQADTELAAEHLGNLVWRALAYAQQELEAMGRAPLAPRAVLPKEVK